MGSIEALLVGPGQAWQTVVSGGALTERRASSLAILDYKTIVVFGGFGGGYRSDGYLFDVCSNATTAILGQEDDL